MSGAAARFSSHVAGPLSRLSRPQQCGAMLALALGTSYTLLRQRLVPRWMARTWFLLSATACIIPSSALLYLIDPLRYLGLPRRLVQTINVYIMVAAFKAVCLLNPQVRMMVKFDDSADGKPQSWADVPRSGFALTLNHTSFWDVFEMIGATPVSHLVYMRTLMKSSLRKIPIFGGIFDRVGHFPVYFKSDQDGNFSVDKERQAVVSRHVDWHLSKGGSIVLFPEGAINKTPDTLQAFRYGTFATIFQHRMPLYYMVSVGNEKTWPPRLPYGGIAADVYVRIGAFPIDFDTEDSKEVAKKLQARMQQVRDEMVAEMAEAAKKEKGTTGPAPVPQMPTEAPASAAPATA